MAHCACSDSSVVLKPAQSSAIMVCATCRACLSHPHTRTPVDTAAIATEMEVSRHLAWLGDSTHPMRSPPRMLKLSLSPWAVSNLAVMRANTALASLTTSSGSPMKYSAAERCLRLIAGKNCLRSRKSM